MKAPLIDIGTDEGLTGMDRMEFAVINGFIEAQRDADQTIIDQINESYQLALDRINELEGQNERSIVQIDQLEADRDDDTCSLLSEIRVLETESAARFNLMKQAEFDWMEAILRAEKAEAELAEARRKAASG